MSVQLLDGCWARRLEGLDSSCDAEGGLAIRLGVHHRSACDSPLMKKGFWLDLEDEKEELCDISRGVPSARPRSLYL
jgi:hypothetical protein